MTDDEQMAILDEAGTKVHDRLEAGGRKVLAVVTVVLFEDGGKHMAAALDPALTEEFDGVEPKRVLAATFHTAADHLTEFAHDEGVCGNGPLRGAGPAAHHRGTA